MHVQISMERGSMKEKTPGFCFSGFLIMMLMPSFMNGMLKSTTRSLADVIVNGAIAMSASCIRQIYCNVCRSHDRAKSKINNRRNSESVSRWNSKRKSKSNSEVTAEVTAKGTVKLQQK